MANWSSRPPAVTIVTSPLRETPPSTDPCLRKKEIRQEEEPLLPAVPNSLAQRSHSSSARPESQHTPPPLSPPLYDNDELIMLRKNSRPSQPTGITPNLQGKATSPRAFGEKATAGAHDPDSLQVADDDNAELHELLNAVQKKVEEMRDMVARWTSEHEEFPTALVHQRVDEIMAFNYRTWACLSAQRSAVHSVKQEVDPEEAGIATAVRGGPFEQDRGNTTGLVDLPGEEADNSVAGSKIPCPHNTGRAPRGRPKKFQKLTSSGWKEQTGVTSNSGGEKAKRVPKDPQNLTIHNIHDFKNGLRKIGMESMGVPGGGPIDLCYLARETVKVAHDTHERAIERYRQQLDCYIKAEIDHCVQLKLDTKKFTRKQLESEMGWWRHHHPEPELPMRIVPEEQAWQIMFNLITHVFYPSQEQVLKFAQILANPSEKNYLIAGCSDLDRKPERPSKDIAASIESLARKKATIEGGAVDDSVLAGKKKEIESQITEHEMKLENITSGFRMWMSKAIDGPLAKLYDNYDRAQTVREFNKISALAEDEEHKHIFELLLMKEGIEPRKTTGVSTCTLVLTYIRHKLSAARGEIISTNKILSNHITQMRPVVELNQEFGNGILAFLGKNNRNLQNGFSKKDEYSGDNTKSSEKKPYKLHQKIGYMAHCLLEMDRKVFHGRLATMLSDVDELIVKPALELRAGQKPTGQLLKGVSQQDLDAQDVGQRVEYVLKHLKGEVEAGEVAHTTTTGEKRREREWSSADADEGGYRAKRPRHGSYSDDSVSRDDTDSAGAGC